MRNIKKSSTYERLWKLWRTKTKKNLRGVDVQNPGGALGYFFGGYVPPGTPNWHPVLEKFSPKIDTPL